MLRDVGNYAGHPLMFGTFISVAVFACCLYCFKKGARRKTIRMAVISCRDLPVRPIQGQQLKLPDVLIYCGLTATTAAKAGATSQQLSLLARHLDHHAQGPSIQFGAIPHFDEESISKPEPWATSTIPNTNPSLDLI